MGYSNIQAKETGTVSTPEQTIRRLYVEKKPEYDVERRRLLRSIREQVHVYTVEDIRILLRYDLYDCGSEVFPIIRDQVFADPTVDRYYTETLPNGNYHSIAVEYLPGQFDARAYAASQAMSLILDQEQTPVQCATVHLVYGTPSEQDLDSIRRYLINPVDSREASLDKPPSLEKHVPRPEPVHTVTGFTAKNNDELEVLRAQLGLAMYFEDIELCREYFKEEQREPTLTELRLLDTYWSDHCRHTTFNTLITDVRIEEHPDTAHLRESWQLFCAYNRRYRGSQEGFSLMDVALAALREGKRAGVLEDLEESEEINAASLHVEVDTPAGREPWLVMFKNETHNHPTEIEPFGGAATCLGGAIRDPLSGRAYVYQALRLTGSGDPTVPIEETRPGKLPQRVITTEAAHGYSSYGNQVGVATGQVREVYHPGFVAKRLEMGAVIGAVPYRQVRRERPVPGDLVILVGGATGRDGIGGATGSSKGHTQGSLETAAAEVQKGNPPEERALQRFFRTPGVARCIKKSNDFGAGGVSVAIGELAAGLDIDLDTIPKKYAGLGGTELALSESQERMAIVIDPGDRETIIELAAEENLQATVVAEVTDTERIRMYWQGDVIVDLSRRILDSGGAKRYSRAYIPAPALPRGSDSHQERPALSSPDNSPDQQPAAWPPPRDQWFAALKALNTCSRHGLIEQFDSTVGARTVLMPFGGALQMTPTEAMAALLPVPEGDTSTVSFMASGYNPDIASEDPYRGGLYAVVEAVCRLVATGAPPRSIRLSMQEYFERLEDKPERWGKPLAALLGAFRAQMDLEMPAVGGKDSMSGSYEELSVPPTLAAIGVATGDLSLVTSPEFKGPGHDVILLAPPVDERGIIDLMALRALLEAVYQLIQEGKVAACRSLHEGGIVVALAQMCFGNNIGVWLHTDHNGSMQLGSGTRETAEYTPPASREDNPDWWEPSPASQYTKPDWWDRGEQELYGGFILEVNKGVSLEKLALPEGTIVHVLGETTTSPAIRSNNGLDLSLESLAQTWLSPLADVFPIKPEEAEEYPEGGGHQAAHSPRTERTAPAGNGPPAGRLQSGMAGLRPSRKARITHPLVCIPVFPGTNCEDETSLRFEEAGARTKQVVFRNKTIAEVERSITELAAAIARANIVALPGGFSAADEPAGAGKYIAAVLQNGWIREAIEELLYQRDGLMLGICNGFQALVRTGLVISGTFYRPEEETTKGMHKGMPALTVNSIGRHVSRYIHTRAESTNSPWTHDLHPGQVHAVPISHGEGRFIADPALVDQMWERGQIAFTYCDREGNPAISYPHNPNGSMSAIEGITSPDGRILGKMGHSERIGKGVAINIPGEKDQGLFRAGVRYFSDQ